MRKLKIIEHMSLDGVIQNSDDDDDFPYGDWSGPYRSPAGREATLAAYGERFDLLLGRRTYDGWSTFWPKAPSESDGGQAQRGNEVRRHPPAARASNGVRSRALDRTSSRAFAASSRRTARTSSSRAAPR